MWTLFARSLISLCFSPFKLLVWIHPSGMMLAICPEESVDSTPRESVNELHTLRLLYFHISAPRRICSGNKVDMLFFERFFRGFLVRKAMWVRKEPSFRRSTGHGCPVSKQGQGSRQLLDVLAPWGSRDRPLDSFPQRVSEAQLFERWEVRSLGGQGVYQHLEEWFQNEARSASDLLEGLQIKW